MFILDQDGDLVSVSDCKAVYLMEHTEERENSRWCMCAKIGGISDSRLILFKGTESECLEYRAKLVELLKKHNLIFD